MPYKYGNKSLHTKKFCTGLSLTEIHCYTRNSHFIFEPPFGGSEAMYAVHLRLTGKPVLEFPIVITELFPLSVMGEALRSNIHWKLLFLRG